MVAPPRKGKGVGEGPHSGNFFFVTHDDNYRLFTLGQMARPGIAKTSMFGTVDTLKMNARGVYGMKTSPPISLPGKASVTIKANDAHPLLSFSAMVAPSPDWFFGVPNVNLKQGGRWVDSMSINVMAYDAGSDSGTKFQNMPDVPTKPPQPVSVLGKPLWKNGKAGMFGTLNITRVN
jgi:hypothetical protein